MLFESTRLKEDFLDTTEFSRSRVINNSNLVVKQTNCWNCIDSSERQRAKALHYCSRDNLGTKLINDHAWTDSVVSTSLVDGDRGIVVVFITSASFRSARRDGRPSSCMDDETSWSSHERIPVGTVLQCIASLRFTLLFECALWCVIYAVPLYHSIYKSDSTLNNFLFFFQIQIAIWWRNIQHSGNDRKLLMYLGLFHCNP